MWSWASALPSPVDRGAFSSSPRSLAKGELVSFLFRSSNNQPLCARRGAGPCPWGLMAQDEFPGTVIAT